MPASLSALNRGRRAAEADMRDVCVITAESGERGPWNNETLDYDPAPLIETYRGKCKITFGSVEPRERTAADQDFAEQAGKLALPVKRSAAVTRGQALRIISSVTDPDMADAVFKIGAHRFRSSPTSRRFLLEETQ